MKSDVNALVEELQSLKLLILEIRENLDHPIVKPDDELWTVEQVGHYLRKAKGTIQSHYQGKSGFPRSKKIGAKHFWNPKEIIAYARRPKGY